MSNKRNVYLSTLAALLLAVMFGFPLSHIAAAAQRNAQPDSKQVSDLLSQAKMQADQVKNDTADLETLNSVASWQSHAAKVKAIKEDVNNVGQTAAKLNGLRNEASPWQKIAIDRINPLLKDLADDTTSIIAHLTKEQGRLLNTPEHQALLRSNAEDAADLAEMVGDLVMYGETRAKYLELRDNLEISERAPRN